MRVGLTYAEPGDQVWLNLEVPDGSTLMEAIEASGILKRFPHIDLEKQKVGVFGKIKSLETTLNEGDRVEIYRPIIADPKKVKRRKADDDDDED